MTSIRKMPTQHQATKVFKILHKQNHMTHPGTTVSLPSHSLASCSHKSYSSSLKTSCLTLSWFLHHKCWLREWRPISASFPWKCCSVIAASSLAVCCSAVLCYFKFETIN